MDKRIILATAALLVLSLAPGVAAQPTTISGQIIDQSGIPVEGVAVYLYQWGVPATSSCDVEGECKEDAYQSYEAKAVSDAEGRYTLAAQSGWANLNFHKDGYAGHYESREVTGDQVFDVTMLKFPEKTAHVTGVVSSGGNALPFVSISVESPLYGVYECSVIEGDDQARPVAIGTEPAADGAVASDEARMIAPGEPYPGYQGCAITVYKDGSFSGNVTPGYSILRFYHQDWRQEGGPEYYPKVFTRTLAADATTKLDVTLKARPVPDAIIEGYIVDAETKEARPGVHINLNSLEGYGWASVQTDKDGSFRAAMPAGMVQVSVYAQGYLQWEGDLTAIAADAVRYDIHLTAGENRYGGCCIAYAETDVKTMGAAGDDAELAPGAPAPSAAPAARGDGEEASSATAVRDLGGGLGPYDAASAPQSGDADAGEPAVKGAPGFEAIAGVLGLMAIVLLRRK